MRILLTGSTGLLGNAIISSSISDQHEIIAPNRKNLDLLNQSQVMNFLSQNHFDLVLHAAAKVGGIQANVNSPFEFGIENITIDANLISACRYTGIRNFIYFGSSCMYPHDTTQPMKINQILTGKPESTNQNYALAKIVGSELVSSVSDQYKLNYKTLILSNIYGIGERLDKVNSHLIPAILLKFRVAKNTQEKDVHVWGSGLARREFTYASDVTDWLSHNIEKIDSWPKQMNLGYGTDFSINDYYSFAEEISGLKVKFEYDLTKPEGMKQKLLDSSIASNHFGWSPKTHPKEGMSKLWEWMLHHE